MTRLRLRQRPGKIRPQPSAHRNFERDSRVFFTFALLAKTSAKVFEKVLKFSIGRNPGIVSWERRPVLRAQHSTDIPLSDLN